MGNTGENRYQLVRIDIKMVQKGIIGADKHN
jgi:hypothetical protein